MNKVARLLPILSILMLLCGVVLLAVLSVPLLHTKENLAAVSSADVVSLTNEERAHEGGVPLQRNSLLDEAAAMKAKDMAAKGYYAHVSPEGLTPMHWADLAGYKYLILGENLVVNRTDAEQVVDAFMASPGHRTNILRKDFTEIGVGVANGTYKGKNATFTVQLFAAPYPTTSPTKTQTPKASVKPVVAVSGASAVPTKQKAPSVPRAVPVATSTSSTSKTTSVTDSLQDKVTVLIQPLTSIVDAASTAPYTTFVGPVFVLRDMPPIELAGVSQLEAETLPVQVGSGWTMQFRLFVDDMVRKAWGLFGA